MNTIHDIIYRLDAIASRVSLQRGINVHLELSQVSFCNALETLRESSLDTFSEVSASRRLTENARDLGDACLKVQRLSSQIDLFQA